MRAPYARTELGARRGEDVDHIRDEQHDGDGFAIVRIGSGVVEAYGYWLTWQVFATVARRLCGDTKRSPPRADIHIHHRPSRIHSLASAQAIWRWRRLQVASPVLLARACITAPVARWTRGPSLLNTPSHSPCIGKN